MSSTSQVRRNHTERAPLLDGSQGRHRLVRILFVHRDPGDVERYVQELQFVGFKVSADIVLTPEQFMARLISQVYDLVVAEYPSPNWKGSQALQLLHQTVQEIPLLFVTTAVGSGSIAELT